MLPWLKYMKKICFTQNGLWNGLSMHAEFCSITHWSFGNTGSLDYTDCLNAETFCHVIIKQNHFH